MDFQIGVAVGLHADNDIACPEIIRVRAASANFKSVTDEGEVRVDVVENRPVSAGFPLSVAFFDVGGKKVKATVRDVRFNGEMPVVFVLAVPREVFQGALYDEGSV